MSITTTEQEKKRLRSYLNPAIKGPVTDAILESLATSSAYLINNVRNVGDQMYIVSAQGRYLDERLSEFGITRPPQIGLSDDVFRSIGIEVANRKQVRDLINNLLNAIFGDEFVRASNACNAFEPYNLQNGDTLIINFDDSKTVSIKFNTNQFSSIAAAKAQEVADVITKTLRNSGLSGTAIAKNDGNGAYVEILSDTIGAASSVTVLGGRAQNVLKFDAAVPAGGNLSTQWTISLQSGGVVRFTWTGGANPQVGKVTAGNYVNIFGGGFSSSANEGSYTILTAVGGSVGNSYFEISNPLGTSGIVTQGIDTAVLFYNPVRKNLISKLSYAAVFQTETNILQIFMPAVTKVIRRGRIGSAHIHYPPSVSYQFNSQPINGDIFVISNTLTIVAGTNFTIGSTIQDTISNMSTAINTVTGLKSYANDKTLNVFQNSLSLTLVGTYSGIQNIVASGPVGDVASLEPNQQGPYSYDLSQPFTVSNINTTLSQNLDGTMSRIVQVSDSSQFPDSQGYLVFDYGSQNQEGPVPYIARPSNTTLLISPAYNIKNTHLNGSNVSLLASKSSADLSRAGDDYQFYVTDVVSGRLYAQNLIDSITASGITVVYTILYPGDIGLGRWGTQYSEISQIYGG